MGLREHNAGPFLPQRREQRREDRSRVPFILAIGLVVGCTLVGGCVSAAKAKADAQAAYIAGQQEGLARGQQGAKLNVTVVGPVRNSIIPWSEGLTLANAIVAAEYFGKTDPKQIFIVRHGIVIPMDPRYLLNGKDVPLQAGDLVQIQP